MRVYYNLDSTADIVSPLLGIKEFEISDMLKEQSKGHLNGMETGVIPDLINSVAVSGTIKTRYPCSVNLSNIPFITES